MTPNHRLAIEFCNCLANDIGAELLPVIAAKNSAQYYVECCASHEYCDANMSMIRAFETTFGLSPDPASAIHAGMINAAWDIAKAAGFDVAKIANGIVNLNSFQSWAIKAAHEKGFRCRAKANWVEIMRGTAWREYMSVSGVCDAIGDFNGTDFEGEYK